MSQEGVRSVLQRWQSELDGWELCPLALWRDARTGKDPRAVEVWSLYKSRVNEVAIRWAAERYGRPLPDLDHEVCKALRAEASEHVGVELYDELAAAPR